MKFENASRLFADCVASIDARRLYRLGLFAPARETLFVQCQVDSAEAPEVEVRVAWDPAAREVRLSAPGQGGARGATVAVGRRAVPRGGGYYFVCPVTGERCEKLYFVDGDWAGRRAKRLGYSSQSGSLGDRHRHSLRRLTALLEDDRRPLASERRAEIQERIGRLEARIAALPRRGVTRIQPDPQNFADLIPLARAAGAPAPAATGVALGTEAALDRAEATGDLEDAVGWLFHRADHSRNRVGRPPEGLASRVQGLRPDFCEDHPRLSLRAFVERGLLRPGWRRGAALDWAGLGCGLDRAAVLFDLRDDDLWICAIEAQSGRDTFEQVLHIVRSEAGEARFVCPVSGVETEILAFRAGAFAAPEPLRLTRRTGRA